MKRLQQTQKPEQAEAGALDRQVQSLGHYHPTKACGCKRVIPDCLEAELDAQQTGDKQTQLNTSIYTI